MEASGLHNMVCCGGNGLVINDELIMNTPLDRGSLCFVHIQWDFRCSSILFCHEEIFIDKNAVVLHCNAEHGIRYIEKSQTTGGMDL